MASTLNSNLRNSIHLRKVLQLQVRKEDLTVCQQNARIAIITVLRVYISFSSIQYTRHKNSPKMCLVVELSTLKLVVGEIEHSRRRVTPLNFTTKPSYSQQIYS